MKNKKGGAVMIKDFESYPQHLREFAHYKLTVEGRSERTVIEYLSDMRTFCRFLVAKREGLSLDAEALMEMDISSLDMQFFEKISKGDVFDFLTFVLGDRQNGTAARSRKLSAIRSFYKYMTVKRNYFENNPAKDMESPKKKKQLPKHLSVD